MGRLSIRVTFTNYTIYQLVSQLINTLPTSKPRRNKLTLQATTVLAQKTLFVIYILLIKQLCTKLFSQTKVRKALINATNKQFKLKMHQYDERYSERFLATWNRYKSTFITKKKKKGTNFLFWFMEDLPC